MTTIDMTAKLDEIAAQYLQAAYSSNVARTVAKKKDQRAQSYGLLRALMVILGQDEALRLIERRYEQGVQFSGGGIDALLYEFWTLDRPS